MQGGSIVYCGQDFSDLCSAEVIGRTASPVEADAMVVPGRAGALIVGGRVLPVSVTVRLYLDAGFKMTGSDIAEARRKLAFWLCKPGGGELVLPDEPERAYRDALFVAAGAWRDLESDGHCDVTFMLYDPIAYGMERIEQGTAFNVGGTWPTLPEFRLVAEAGSRIAVRHLAEAHAVVIDYEFAGGEKVTIDCVSERVCINDVDASDCVALGSDFFALDPGDCILSVTGATRFETRFTERWV